MAVTLKTIAKECGVSHAVVGSVLSGKENPSIRYSEETRRNVEEAARRLGYRRNRSAAMLRSQSHQSVALLLSKLGFVSESVLQELIQELHGRGYVLTLDKVEAPRVLEEASASVALAFEDVPRFVERRLREAGVGLVKVNTSTRRGRGCITYDEENAVAQAVERFAAHGCRRPLFVYQAASEHYSFVVRRNEFRKCAREAGMQAPLELAMPDAWSSDLGKYAEFLKGHDDIDCALMYSSNLSPYFYMALRMAGLEPGEDVKIMAFNETALARAVRPNLSVLLPDRAYLTSLILEGLEKLEAQPEADWKARCPMIAHLRESA